MAVKGDHQVLLKKLKNKVKVLEKKVHVMKGKLAEARTSGYVNAAIHIEHEVMKGIEKKGKALASALNKIEMKYAAKLSKSLSQKGKKTGKAKRVSVKKSARRK